ncbi:hypothetical protein ACHAW6_007755 [Cyclotella cf. meneghiniana]
MARAPMHCHDDVPREIRTASHLSFQQGLCCHLSVKTKLLAKRCFIDKGGEEYFRPPRIQLRNPPPSVKFSEWDIMIELLFNRMLLTKSRFEMIDDIDIPESNQQWKQQQQKQQIQP